MTRASENWANDHLQFARLLGEIQAAGGLDAQTTRMVCESMDLSPDEIDQLLARAQEAWDAIVAATGDTEERRRLDELRQQAINFHGSEDVEVDRLWPHDISEADKGTWVRGWLWLANTDEEEPE